VAPKALHRRIFVAFSHGSVLCPQLEASYLEEVCGMTMPIRFKKSNRFPFLLVASVKLPGPLVSQMQDFIKAQTFAHLGITQLPTLVEI
jgi:hypothetical protein